jgi:hypothetical protein
MADKKVYIVVCNTCAYVPYSIYGVFDQRKIAIAYRNKLNLIFKGYRSYEVLKQIMNEQRQLKGWEK